MTSFQDGIRLDFADRRAGRSSSPLPGLERRQFGNTYSELSADARELAVAIDTYKVEHHRRYITFEEMLRIVQKLGYSKMSQDGPVVA